jgi:hypothetical protein
MCTKHTQEAENELMLAMTTGHSKRARRGVLIYIKAFILFVEILNLNSKHLFMWVVQMKPV